ncbi:O-Antigen ligase [Lishizhenia tianjinensis]|uniref:O-Antigen ligase n=1 Tax=Lishizhenia tianjinensis TaxID=477690 RepID=A0A1I7AP86_9FLAO|nr:O-antigen ligase family protein [Lishizhenia tianjinensis]SFT76749.1 O-Antigen ligase [Lishizhenia tianjinensis]
MERKNSLWNKSILLKLESFPLILSFLILVFSPLLFQLKLSGRIVTLDLLIIPLSTVFYFVRSTNRLKVFYFSLPILLLLIWGGVMYGSIPESGKVFANMELRILLVSFFFVNLFLYSFQSLGREKFTAILKYLLWGTLVIVLGIGAVEKLWGFHFVLENNVFVITEFFPKFRDIPIFIWHNPNNYIAYLLVLVSGLILFDKFLSKKLLLQLLIFLVLFVYSNVAQARYGLLASMIFGAFLLLSNLINIRQERQSFIKWIGVTLGVGIFTFSTVEFIQNNKFSIDAKMVNTSKVKEMTVEQDLSVQYVDISDTEKLKELKDELKLGSDIVRYNLIRNGLDYFVQEPIKGIGPGQYQYKTQQDQGRYFVAEVWASHHYLIDILSEYGLIGIIFILSLVLGFLWIFKKGSWLNRITLITAFLLFVIAGNLPSKFMNMTCSALMLGVIFVYYLSFFSKEDKAIKD